MVIKPYQRPSPLSVPSFADRPREFTLDETLEHLLLECDGLQYIMESYLGDQEAQSQMRAQMEALIENHRAIHASLVRHVKILRYEIKRLLDAQ